MLQQTMNRLKRYSFRLAIQHHHSILQALLGKVQTQMLGREFSKKFHRPKKRATAHHRASYEAHPRLNPALPVQGAALVFVGCKITQRRTRLRLGPPPTITKSAAPRLTGSWRFGRRRTRWSGSPRRMPSLPAMATTRLLRRSLMQRHGATSSRGRAHREVDGLR